MNELELLKHRVEILERVLREFYRSDRYRFPRDLELPSGVHIRVSNSQDEGAGTKIGINPTDKLAFWGAEPVAQQLNLGVPSRASVSGSGDDVNINNNFIAIQSKFDDLDQILINVGITAA